MSSWHWNRRFIDLAATVAQWSKDGSTKCGCVIVRPNKSIASLGFNGFPQGMKDDSVFLEALQGQDRQKKLERVIHAEMNALLFLPERGPGLTLYVYPMLPCHRCAVHIIQTGIARVIAPINRVEHWRGSVDLTKQFFAEAKVIYEEIDYEAKFTGDLSDVLGNNPGGRGRPGAVPQEKAPTGPGTRFDYDL